MKTKTKAAPIMDIATLVDQIGTITATIANFEQTKKELVAALLARAGDAHYIDGNDYTATIVAAHTVSSLDTDRIKELMGLEWVAMYSKESIRKPSVRVTARKKPDQKKKEK